MDNYEGPGSLNSRIVRVQMKKCRGTLLEKKGDDIETWLNLAECFGEMMCAMCGTSPAKYL